jgi:tetratricopeptide (TPR) repeat protein
MNRLSKCFLFLLFLSAATEVCAENDSTAENPVGNLTATVAITKSGTTPSPAQLNEDILKYRKQLESEPSNVDVHAKLGTTLAMAGRQPEAITEFREALRIEPKSAQLHRVLGLILLQSNNKAESLRELQEATRLAPEDPKCQRAFGSALLAVGRTRDAIEPLQIACRLEPNSYQGHESLGVAYLCCGMHKEAFHSFSNAIKIQDTRQARLARTRAATGARQSAPVIADCDAILRAAPGDHEALAVRAFANSRLGKIEAAIADAQAALQSGQDYAYVAHVALGIAHVSQKNVNLGISDFSDAISANPTRPMPYVWRAVARNLLFRTNEAIEDLDAAIRTTDTPENLNLALDGFGWQVYKFRGVLNVTCKFDYKAACNDFTHAIALHDSDADCYALRGLSHWGLQEHATALTDLEKSLSLDPDNNVALFPLTWILASAPHAELRDGKRAIKIATAQCTKAKWKDPMWLACLAAAHAEVGDFEKAVEIQEKAVETPATRDNFLASRIKIWEENTSDLIGIFPKVKKSGELLTAYRNRTPCHQYLKSKEHDVSAKPAAVPLTK